MINLEWLRTFRTVYKTESLTKAAEALSISQPAVSQHIAALEVQVKQKLFIRKSKGVTPSDYARSLNNLIAHSLEDLEEVEALFQAKPKDQPIVNLGISTHLFQALLGQKLADIPVKLHVSFSSGEKLIKETEEGKQTYAVIPGVATNFDTDCHPFMIQRLILVHSSDLDLTEFEQLFDTDRKAAERWLSKQDWYSHRPVTPFIKQFWMDVFDKKRPEIIPCRVIPDESQILAELAKGSGLALCFDNNAAPFLENGSLKRSRVESTVSRELSLLANRKRAAPEITEQLLAVLRPD